MVQLLSNGSSREVAERSGHYSPPRLNGNIYAVVRHGAGYEVRCWSFRSGRQVDDELVDSFETEKLADSVARILAEGMNLALASQT